MAFPTFLLAVTPSLVIPSSFFLAIAMKCLMRQCFPERFALTKSARRNSLSHFGREKAPLKPGENRFGLKGIYTVSRFRPLALLLFRIFIPARVRILALKPWVRALFILLG